MSIRCVMIALFLLLSVEPATWGQSLKSKTTQYTLPNGMQVVLVEKHANPMIACMVYVNAGSKYENDQNNGVTHFLEHLLFDGTKTRTREDITEGIEAKGGYINAFTSKELTCYMVLMPNEFIETGLAVQSDMLFNSVLPDEELPKERKIVIEEIKQSKDNVDYQVEKFFDSTAYAGTPFERTVLGGEEIIARIPKEEILDYYHTYYEPNNMVTLVIGDFETEKMKALIEKYYGVMPKKSLPAQAQIQFTPPAGQQVKSRKADARSTYVNLCFNAPRFDDPHYFAFDMLTEILNLGETSPLTKALTEGDDPLATQVSAHLETQREFSTLNISIITDSPKKVERILKTTVAVLEELASSSPEAKQLSGVIVSSKTHRYYQEEKLHFYGMMAASYVVTCGWDWWDSYVDNLEKLTPQAVQTVAQKYFSDPKYVATVVEPAN